MGVKHVHGGQTKILGIHDYKSKLNWVALLKDETAGEVLRAWREFFAYASSHNVTIRHVLRRRIGDRGGNYGEFRFLSKAKCEDACGIKGFDTTKYAALVCQENWRRRPGRGTRYTDDRGHARCG